MSDHPRGQPHKPEEATPHEGTSPATNPDGATPNGIPDHQGDEPTGWPNSDRHQNETVPGKK